MSGSLKIGDTITLPYCAPWYVRFRNWLLQNPTAQTCDYKVTAVSDSIVEYDPEPK